MPQFLRTMLELAGWFPPAPFSAPTPEPEPLRVVESPPFSAPTPEPEPLRVVESPEEYRIRMLRDHRCPNCESLDSMLGGPEAGICKNIMCDACGARYNLMGPFGVDTIPKQLSEAEQAALDRSAERVKRERTG